MINGKDLGAAIDEAIRLKVESGAVRSKAEIARHFGGKPQPPMRNGPRGIFLRAILG